MGHGSWKPEEFVRYSTAESYETKSTHEIFSQRHIDKDLDPKDVKIRESRDSVDNPNSTPIIVALDVTGSMSEILDSMAREGLNTLVTEVHNRKPVSDPHVLCMGIGDLEFDKSPLQVTQFEADLRIAQQLTKIYLERGGGNNLYESYSLAWYFAAFHTNTDCFEKRGKKGYLFTVGDELPTDHINPSDLSKVLGYTPQSIPSTKELLGIVQEKWNVFHLTATRGRQHMYAKSISAWQDLLGQKHIVLPDHKKMAQVIISAIQINEGASTSEVANSWDSETASIISSSIPNPFGHKVVI